jgi:hypothetical protein
MASGNLDRRRMTFWALAGGPGGSAGFLDHPAAPSGEPAEPTVAHDFLRDALDDSLQAEAELTERKNLHAAA